MAAVLNRHRWSTLTLLGVGVALGAIGYFAGSHARAPDSSRTSRSNVSRSPASPDVETSAALRADRRMEFISNKSSLTTEKQQLAEIEALGATDSLRALALASAESNWRLRTLLRNAALRGWASAAPSDAANFALTLPERERREAVAALLQGASNHPDAAAEIARNLCAQDPALAEDHGRALIEALAEVGAFSTLVRFATTDPAGHSADWLNATFYQWAERQPLAAQQAVETLPTSVARQAAFQGLVLGWSMADPRELAAYAITLPPGENRSTATQQALAQWILRDPAAVEAWVMRFDPGPEFDLSAATVATAPKLAGQPPAVALGWAQSIVEPALRESTLTALAHQWAERDPASARRMIEQTPGLLPADRSVLLDGLNSTGGKP